MKIVKGDLIQMAVDGEFDVIVHGCNCFHNMGGGIAAQIAATFPEAEEADFTSAFGDINKMGKYTMFVLDETLPPSLMIINAYTQFNGGYVGYDDFDYASLLKVLKAIKLGFSGLRIGMPWIGCGIAGGDQKLIAAIIEHVFGDDITVVEYQPTPKAAQDEIYHV